MRWVTFLNRFRHKLFRFGNCTCLERESNRNTYNSSTQSSSRSFCLIGRIKSYEDGEFILHNLRSKFNAKFGVAEMVAKSFLGTSQRQRFKCISASECLAIISRQFYIRPLLWSNISARSINQMGILRVRLIESSTPSIHERGLYDCAGLDLRSLPTRSQIGCDIKTGKAVIGWTKRDEKEIQHKSR